MLKIIRNYRQLSPEWFEIRAGKVGGSSIGKIVTATGKKSTQRQSFLYQLAAEILTGKKTESYSNQNMADGIEREPQTRMEFQFITMDQVEEVAGMENTDYPGVFVSPDGLIVGEDAGLELKSVIPATQVKYLDKGILPTEYRLQCQISLMVTEWDTWKFFSFCPGLPGLHVIVHRDEKLIQIIKDEVARFLEDLNNLVTKLRA